MLSPETIQVGYTDKETRKVVSLGTIEAPRFENVKEAVNYFDEQEAGKGEEMVLEYVHTALDIDLQRRYRDAHRPDKPKTSSNLAKFKQLSQDKQEELLKAAGLLS